MYVAGPGVVAARNRVLTQTRWYAEPVGRRRERVDLLLRDTDRLWSDIDRDGCLVVDLDRPLEVAEIYALAGRFGTPMIEDDEAVQAFVTDDVVLDLPTAYGSAPGTALEPFSSSALRMHTESSTLPAARQPWLLFLALVPRTILDTRHSCG